MEPSATPDPFQRLRTRTLLAGLAAMGLALGLASALLPAGTIRLDARGTALVAYCAVGVVLVLHGHFAGLDWRRLFGPAPARDEWPLMLVMVPVATLTFAAALLVFVPLSYVAPRFVQRLMLEPNEFTTVRTVGQWLVLMLAGVVAAPVVEELLFRGILMQRWARKWGTSSGVVASSALFATMHQEWIGHFLFGVALCALYLRTRNLWLVIVAHALNNLVFLAPSITDAFTTEPPPVETLADFRSAGWWAAPLLGLGLWVGHWYLRRYWPGGMMGRVLGGPIAYDHCQLPTAAASRQL